MKRHIICIVILAAMSIDANAQSTDPCKHTNNGDTVVISASSRPQARIVVDLSSTSGRTMSLAFEPSVDAPLAYAIRLPGEVGEIWKVSATGERASVATPDGKGAAIFSYLPETCATKEIALKFSMLVVGIGTASWQSVTAAPEVKVVITTQSATRLTDIGAADATMSASSVVQATRGLDSAIPDAVRETLSLLAEIAMERAKAEGARILKSRIMKHLCEDLTIGAVFGKIDHHNQRLLPATCGQLDNLRLSDLGGSATGFIDALREDTVDVVLPALVGSLATRLPPPVRLASPTAVAVYRIAATAVRRGFTPEAVRLAALALLDVSEIPAPLKRAIRVAIQCTKQQCSLGDLRSLMNELTSDVLAAANVPSAFKPAIDFAIKCATTACTDAELKKVVTDLTASVGLADIANVPPPLQRALAIAISCSKASCTSDHIKTFVLELSPVVLAAARVPTTFQPVVDLAVKCTIQTCTGADLTALVTSISTTVKLEDLPSMPDQVREALEIAVACSKTTCTAQHAKAFVAKLIAVDPFWLDAALRLVTILQSRADADGKKLAGELVDLLLDVTKHECGKDRKCEIVTTAIRDITIGVIEADYLRALGGIQAAFTATGLGSKLKGKPLQLAASIASYISTYRETKDKDAAVARELRKKALEALIDAGTDRTNRERDIIVSIGASVGFTGGQRRLENAPGNMTMTIATKQTLRDIRLPLGLTVQQVPPADRFWGTSWYAMVGIADLAQFVSTPVEATDGTDAVTVEPEVKWSDFVAFEVQLGARFGSDRVPFTLGLDFYYRPRMTLEFAGETQTTAVYHAGIFAGFNVPFFDLN